MDEQVLTWLKRADLIEVVRTDPGATKSGVCVECLSKDGKPVSEVGNPPYHKNCACKTESVQQERQPGNVLDEDFNGIQVPDMFGEEPDPGGVEELTFTL